MIHASGNLPRIGLTKIELAVVLGVMAILITLLMSGVQNARENAARTQCTNYSGPRKLDRRLSYS